MCLPKSNLTSSDRDSKEFFEELHFSEEGPDRNPSLTANTSFIGENLEETKKLKEDLKEANTQIQQFRHLHAKKLKEIE